MTSPSSSNAVSIDEMEAVMRDIEQHLEKPVVAPDPAPAPAPASTSLAATPAESPAPSAPPVAAVTTVAPRNPVTQYVDPDQIQRDAAIDPMDVSGACVVQAARFAYYGQQKMLAKKQVDRMKTAFEILEAQLYDEKRAQLEADAEAEAKRRAADETLTKKDREKGTEKITEGMVDASVKRDRRWFTAKNRIIDAEAIYNLASIACQAYEQRKDMLVTIGADQRQEREGELRIRERGTADAGARIMNVLQGGQKAAG